MSDKDYILNFHKALINAIMDNSEENIVELIRTNVNLLANLCPDEFPHLYPNRIAALLSKEYKELPFKIGDKLHIKEGEFVDDCVLTDVALIYDIDFKPTLAFIVKLPNGEERKLKDINSIAYKWIC